MAQYPTDGDIDTTFPDNNTGEIGADDMRTFQKQMTAAGRDYQAMTENLPTEFPPSAHTHIKAEITDFAHTHTKSEITDFAHTHTESEITDLDKYTQAEVDAALGDKVNGTGLSIEVVASLPGTPDANTIYFVTG